MKGSGRIKKLGEPGGGGGVQLYSQHSGGRGWWISVSSRPSWSTEQVPRHPMLHKETLSKKLNQTKNTKGTSRVYDEMNVFCWTPDILQM